MKLATHGRESQATYLCHQMFFQPLVIVFFRIYFLIGFYFHVVLQYEFFKIYFAQTVE